jgi:hypothetical protein
MPCERCEMGIPALPYSGYFIHQVPHNPVVCSLSDAERYPDCWMCQKYAGKFAPSHRGSSFCKCGSIASGGDKAHCTCDLCF